MGLEGLHLAVLRQPRGEGGTDFFGEFLIDGVEFLVGLGRQKAVEEVGIVLGLGGFVQGAAFFVGFPFRCAAGTLGRFVQGASFLMGLALNNAAGAFLFFLGLLLRVLGVFRILRIPGGLVRGFRRSAGTGLILTLGRLFLGLDIVGAGFQMRTVTLAALVTEGALGRLRRTGFTAGGSGGIFVLSGGLISGGTGFRLGFAVFRRRAPGLARVRRRINSGRRGLRGRVAGILTVGDGQRTGEHHGDHQSEADDGCQ